MRGKKMNNDKAVVEEAYRDELKQMFKVLYQNSLVDGIDAAVQRFKDGLAKLRTTRDRAIQVVGQEKRSRR